MYEETQGNRNTSGSCGQNVCEGKLLIMFSYLHTVVYICIVTCVCVLQYNVQCHCHVHIQQTNFLSFKLAIIRGLTKENLVRHGKQNETRVRSFLNRNCYSHLVTKDNKNYRSDMSIMSLILRGIQTSA